MNKMNFVSKVTTMHVGARTFKNELNNHVMIWFEEPSITSLPEECELDNTKTWCLSVDSDEYYSKELDDIYFSIAEGYDTPTTKLIAKFISEFGLFAWEREEEGAMIGFVNRPQSSKNTKSEFISSILKTYLKM
jgi:hypothetical protein